MEIAECGVFLLLSQLVFELHEQLHVRFWLGRAPPDQPSPGLLKFSFLKFSNHLLSFYLIVFQRIFFGNYKCIFV